MGRRVTMQVVADCAGVSKAAVSRALAAGPCDLAAATRQRIRRLAESMGYAPPDRRHPAARVAVVVASVLGHPILFAQAVERAVRGAGLTPVVILVSGEGEAAVRAVLKGGFAAALLIDPLPAALAQASALRLPLLRINQRTPGPAGSLVVDDAGSARIGVEHLHARGFQRIIYFDNGRHARHSSIADRRQGYAAAMSDLGREPCVLVSLLAQAADRIAACTERTGVLAYNASDGVRLFDDLRRRGIPMPERVGVLCFDDDDSTWLLGMSVLRQPVEELSRRAVDALVRQMDCWPRPAPLEDCLLPCMLIPRAST